MEFLKLKIEIILAALCIFLVIRGFVREFLCIRRKSKCLHNNKTLVLRNFIEHYNQYSCDDCGQDLYEFIDEVTQEEFNKAFNDILKGSIQIYLNPKTNKISKEKTSHIKVFDSEGMWLLDYNTDSKNSYFWYQYDRVYVILRDKLSLQFEEIQLFMKSLVETQFKMKDTIPGFRIIHKFIWLRHSSK
jgi:hypothetical protein